jgi:hypothetical protein
VCQRQHQTTRHTLENVTNTTIAQLHSDLHQYTTRKYKSTLACQEPNTSNRTSRIMQERWRERVCVYVCVLSGESQSVGTYKDFITLAIATIILDDIDVIDLFQQSNLDHQVFRNLVFIGCDDFDGHGVTSWEMSALKRCSCRSGHKQYERISTPPPTWW